MGSALQTTAPNTALTELTADEFMDVARNSLYPGALDASIKAVWSYCRAARLDPMQKPVHIVGMSVKKAGTRDQYEWRDVILPGINLYRTNAARTDEHIGTGEPEFGPPVTGVFGEGKARVEVVYPEWCKVTVRRLKKGQVCEYVAKEFWIENYATAGRDTDYPNTMWRKRPFGQLAKCAEAQALRRAFPESNFGVTADELEGKVIEGDCIAEPEARPMIQMPQAKAETQPATPATIDGATGEVQTEASPAKPQAANSDATPASDGLKRLLRAKLAAATLGDADVRAKFGFGVDDIATKGQIAQVQAWIQNPAG